MQSVSQGSLKLQAHKDKVINQGASTTKRRFLQHEIRFLTQFKEQSEILNQLAKPTSDPPSQLSKLSKKMEKQFINHLAQEIVFTRRQISLQQINDDSVIQTKIAHNYQNSIQQFNHKLECIEGIVQQTEQKKKCKETILIGPNAPFKLAEYHKLLEENISQRKKIKEILRERLALSGSIKKLQEKQKNQLILSKRVNHKLSTFHYLTHHKQLYRIPSTDHIVSRQQKASKKRLKVPIILSNFYLKTLQRQMFIEQLQKIKNINNKLQISITLLKQAVTQREEDKILKQLNQEKQLPMEQSIAREIFAFRKMSMRFQQNLEKSSFMWVFTPKLTPPKTISKEDCLQQLRLQQNRRETKAQRRNKSVEKSENHPSFIKAEASKSNGKTNCSLEIVQH